MEYLGIFLSVGALFAWGFGDFLIQKSTRAIGPLKTLFINDLAAAVVLLPFVWKELKVLDVGSQGFTLLVVAALIMYASGLFDFEALKEGKISVIEPILSLELPLTIGLSVAIAGESLNLPEWILMGIIFVGIILTVTTHHSQLHYHRRLFEKGVLVALVGAVGMGLTNFIIGLSSRQTSPLLTMWFVSVLMAGLSLIWLLSRGEVLDTFRAAKNNFKLVAGQAIIDNLAWIFFVFAVIYIPISIAIAISESYIVFAAFLGMAINREKLRGHQKLGMALAIVAVITLGFLFQQRETDGVEPQGTVTETPAPQTNEPVEAYPAPTPDASLPETYLLQVPFAAQAPFGDWEDERQQDGCEEASVIMAMRWVRGGSLTREQMLDELLKMSDWEQQKYGTYHDTSAADTVARLLNDYYSYYKASVVYDFTAEDIKKELAAGKLVLAPFDGQSLGNPNYSGAGPERHFMVIKGYDDRRGEFTTNDPGTRKGENYKYSYQRLFDSIRDYPTGNHVEISGRKKAIIVLEK